MLWQCLQFHHWVHTEPVLESEEGQQWLRLQSDSAEVNNTDKFEIGWMSLWKQQLISKRDMTASIVWRKINLDI